MDPTLGNPALEILEQEGIFWYILSFYMINYISKKTSNTWRILR